MSAQRNQRAQRKRRAGFFSETNQRSMVTMRQAGQAGLQRYGNVIGAEIEHDDAKAARASETGRLEGSTRPAASEMHCGFSTACCIRKLIACPWAHRQRWLNASGGSVASLLPAVSVLSTVTMGFFARRAAVCDYRRSNFRRA